MKRLTRSGGIFVGAIAGALAVLWLLKDRFGGSSSAPVADEVGFPIAPAPSAPPTTPHDPDDLSLVKGVGPVYQKRLAEAGIMRFDQLAEADATVVAEQIEAPVSRVQTWIDEARRLVR